MITLDEHVDSFTDQERLEIMSDYEELRINGSIGDEPLRRHATEYLKRAHIPNHNIVLTMNMLASACHRYYALKFVDEHFD